MKMQGRSKVRIVVLAAAVLLLSAVFSLSAGAAMDSNYGNSYFPYTFDFLGNPVAAPAAFEASEVLTGYDFGKTAFKDLSDITYNGSSRIYLADSGNNRIIVCDEKLTALTVISEYDFEGKTSGFSNPTCTAVQNGKLYVADSGNARIVVFDEASYGTQKVLTKPKIAALGQYTYIPKKLTVDYSGRIYAIADRINKGLIQLSANGEFEDFLGAPKVVPTASQIMMRKILPRHMREQLIKVVPTEYHALNVDREGFIFVTSKSANIPPIARLNGQGSNVLITEYEEEDEKYLDEAGNPAASMFVDVIPREDGGYFALDSAQSRIFSYDKQGMLLYIFGAPGISKDGFYSAASLEYVDGKIMALDNSRGTLTVFTITEFGEAVNEAVRYASLGKIEEERAAWEKVLKLCSNYEMAQISLAKIEINDQNYRSALNRLSSINEKDHYLVAFRYARAQWIGAHFPLLAGLLAALAAAAVLWKKVVGKTALAAGVRKNAFYREMKYGTYVIFHPFDGFWDLKREKRGTARAALTILGLFALCFGVRTRFTGYQFMTTTYAEVNVLLNLATILIPILLFVVSSCCFTTLMDGKGTMKDGFIAVCYALTPYVLLSPLQLAFSHVLTGDEMSFYFFLDTLVLLWIFALFFFGMMVTHDYTFSKSLVTAVLSLIGICLILFICLLVVNLFIVIYSFIGDIYREISFRFY